MLLIVAIAALAIVIYLYFETFILPTSMGGRLPGRSHTWSLGGARATEVVSNRRLGAIQRHRDVGGIIEGKDQIIVWAREFLDDDVLYSDVSSNIEQGVEYFYILDRQHADRFQTLLRRLHADLEPEIVQRAVNVIFVRPELTLNNFVILAYGTLHEVAYSSLIFGARPFSWIRQSPMRSRIIIERVKVLVAGVALAQAAPERFRPHGPFAYFDVEDQIMDFSELGRRLLIADDVNPEKATFDLKDVVATAPMPAAAESKIAAIRDRLRIV